VACPMEYSTEFKRQMVRRMSGPRAESATKLSKEVGVSQSALSRWLLDAGIVNTVKKSRTDARKPASKWTPEEKLQAVLEAASIADEELGGWLRQRGLRSEDLAEFRAAAISGLAAKAPKPSLADQKRINELERDLKRSKAALAETAALLVLRKKAVALWGEEGDDT
jgi:transposase